MRLRAVLAVGLLSWLVPILPASDIEFYGKTQIRFAGVDEGRSALTRFDDYLRLQSPFDRQSRMQRDQDIPEEAYIAFVREQVLAWPPADIERLTPMLARIGQRLRPFQLALPPIVLLVHTSGQEEAGSAYCRGNAIVWTRAMLDRPDAAVEKTMTHELFHILSSHNPALRSRLYAILGFRPCPEIQLPEGLAARKISNPDAPVLDHLVEIDYQQGKIPVVPLLYSSAERYDVQCGGTFVNYLTIGLLVVQKQGDGYAAAMYEGQPVMLPLNTPGFWDKIGRNTRYLPQPEEILAENFVLLVQGQTAVPTPRILEQMWQLLVRPPPSSP
jgi:hypothetical protein